MTTLPLGPPPAPRAARAVIPGRPVLLGRNTGDRLYRAALTGLALSLPLLLVAVVGWTPFLQGVFYGNSLLAGGVILAIMIVPYIAAVSREVLLAVPSSQREAALGMGATRWEAVWTAVVPYGRAGLIGAVILGLGRALGETMAVTMLSGNRHDIGLSLLRPAYT